MSVVVNKNLYALLENHGRHGEDGFCDTVLCEGSSRSGKTWAIVEYLISCCQAMPELVVRCYRHNGTTHRDTTMRDFRAIMLKEHGESWEHGRWRAGEQEFVFANGSHFEFRSTSEPQKLHGAAPDIAWFNEVMEIGYDAYRQVKMRTRLLTIADWNPSLNHHWVFDTVMGNPGVCYVHSTYQDNPHLPATVVRSLEETNPDVPENVRNGTANKWHWEVYGLGRRSRVEGAVFSNWALVDHWPQREVCIRHGYGLDFGWSDDPTALIECAVANGALYLREIVYAWQLLNTPSEGMPGQPSLHSMMEDADVSGSSARIWADAARPDLIQELQYMGWTVTAAPKGPGSVVQGLDLLNGFKILIHRDSQNLQRELEQYKWKPLPVARGMESRHAREPIDAFNHGIDAARYWALAEVRSKARVEPNQAGRKRRSPVARHKRYNGPSKGRGL